ncbi:ATP-binding protein [Pseudomonas sp.]|jgi:two-component system NtrC family sensor kinase|uniref:ATP-binding protein n=1 Tax=Pseudomonas sp. TaxID=306 RepID=UPI0037C53DF5
MTSNHLPSSGLEAVLENINLGVVVVDAECRVLFWNRFMVIHGGRLPDEAVGRSLFELFPDLPERWLRQRVRGVLTLGNLAFTTWQQRPHLFPFSGTRPITSQLSSMYQNCTFFPLHNGQGEPLAACIAVTDATDIAARQQELERLNDLLEVEKEQQAKLIHRLEEAQAQLLQSEKMAAIGQLAAGVAHEINNPVGFVYSNLNSLRGYIDQLTALVDALQAQVQACGNTQLIEACETLGRTSDYAFLREDTPVLLAESRDGLDRVKRIVKDLREFSHVDNGEWQLADLHQGLDSTLNVIWNEVKFKAKVIKQYGELPPVQCIGAQINQVFLNLIVNAAQAIVDHGTITLRTGTLDDGVFVEVQDDGPGVAEDLARRIFEPFFTTKPVGKGTGLGLSVSYSIIERHNGVLSVSSPPEGGACFRIVMPRRQPASS